LPAVLNLTGISRAQLYRLIARGEFPRQLALTDHGRSVAWDEEAVHGWQQTRLDAARQTGEGSGAR
jgi:prophage regulatory protein